MNRGSRIALGVVGVFGVLALLPAVVLEVMAGDEPGWSLAAQMGLAVFCLAIGLACFMPSSRAVTVRAIGALILAGVVGLHAEDMRKTVAGRNPHIVGQIAISLVVGLLALYVAISAGRYPRWAADLWAAEAERRRRATRKFEPAGWRSWVLLTALAVFAVASVVFDVPMADVLEILVGGAVLAVLAWFVVCHWTGRTFRAALRLARAGDAEGAVRHIRQELEAKGPSAERYNTLGVFLCEQGKWDDAIRALEEAVRLGGREPRYAANQAAALWESGQKEEAAALLETVCRQAPENFDGVSNSCLMLAELGRLEEARERLRCAERLYRVQWVFPASARSARARLLEECRRKAGAGGGG